MVMRGIKGGRGHLPVGVKQVHSARTNARDSHKNKSTCNISIRISDQNDTRRFSLSIKENTV